MRYLLNYGSIMILSCLLFIGCGDGFQTDVGDQVDTTEVSQDTTQIQPYSENPYYWQYNGEPVVLIGGSWQDNLFNHPENLSEHLDLLQSVGGNYVRNVMSHRNEGNEFAYEQDEDGNFDLDDFNEEYWQRFEDFLEMTRKRDIFVQIEIWATWDFYADSQTKGGWSYHPFNPENNNTYTAEETGLPTEIDYEPGEDPTDHLFFRSVPELENNELLLRYQKEFVDKILSYTLEYPHVLYTINNETGEPLEWGDFWAEYLHDQAADTGETVAVSDMRRSNKLRSSDHTHIYDNEDRYTFLEISQNNGSAGQEHYDGIIYVRDQISSQPRPINNVKNYGAAYSGEEETVARMGRILFAGGASARFHRPHPIEDPAKHKDKTEIGLGLSPRAQQIIQSLRMVVDELEIEQMQPDNDQLSNRADDEAYLLKEAGQQYAIYFPDGGSVTLDITNGEGEFTQRWLNLDEGEWETAEEITWDDEVEITTPGEGHWVAVIEKK